ncbi:hypothetical protein HPCPY6261_0386 [Helicobacter pylori CPY6261]|nr:hypothetical protein HPCPY6261_0386 [Helicobacter pylori CPY6261]
MFLQSNSEELFFNQAVFFKRFFGVRGFLNWGLWGRVISKYPPIPLRKWVLLKKWILQ